nr:CoA transferase [Gammaproteobacteria bacterium]
PHFRERGMFESVTYQGRDLEVPSVHPRLTSTPGSTQWAGPELGEHTSDVLSRLLAFDDVLLKELNRDGII